MSENNESLDAIQRRIDAATPGAVTITPSDVTFLLDLARKQQAALDAVLAHGVDREKYTDTGNRDVDSAIRGYAYHVRRVIAEVLEARP